MSVGQAGKWLIVAVGIAACGGESRSISRGEPAAGSESGGTGGTGASGGAGGSETGGIGGESVAPIDDMEGNEDLGLPPGSFYWGQRLGFWFYSTSEVSADAMTEEIDPPRGDSQRAYRIMDEGLVEGMDLWAQLDHPSNQTHDLSGYVGITFWARLESASRRFVVALMDGTPYFWAKADMQEIRSVTLDASPEWQRFVIPFDAFGASVTSASSIDFIAGIGGERFDLWIDDLAFFCNGGCVEPD